MSDLVCARDDSTIEVLKTPTSCHAAIKASVTETEGQNNHLLGDYVFDFPRTSFPMYRANPRSTNSSDVISRKNPQAHLPNI